MANVFYDKCKEKLLTGGISWTADTIKLVLIDVTNYTVNAATHEFLSDIPLAGRVATSPALSGKTATLGVADADDTIVYTVSGAEVSAFVLFKDTGTAATSPLIAYFDTGITGFPYTPTGGNIAIEFPSSANKIFKL